MSCAGAAEVRDLILAGLVGVVADEDGTNPAFAGFRSTCSRWRARRGTAEVDGKADTARRHRSTNLEVRGGGGDGGVQLRLRRRPRSCGGLRSTCLSRGRFTPNLATTIYRRRWTGHHRGAGGDDPPPPGPWRRPAALTTTATTGGSTGADHHQGATTVAAPLPPALRLISADQLPMLRRSSTAPPVNRQGPPPRSAL